MTRSRWPFLTACTLGAGFCLALAPSQSTAATQATTSRDNEAALIADRELWGHELSRSPAASIASYTEEPVPVVLQATRAMGRMHDPDAVALLVPLLVRTEPAVRAEAAFGLGHYEGTTTALLEAAETESDEAVMVALVDALGRTASGEAVPFFLEQLALGSAARAIAACHAIGRLGVRGELRAPAPEVLEPLLDELKRIDHQRRRAASFALARTKPEVLPPHLEQRLEAATLAQPDAVARAWLVRASSTALADESWARVVDETIDDAARGVRIALARGLSTRGTPEDSAALTPLLGDTDRDVAVAAVAAAANLPWHEAWDKPMQGMLDIRDPDLQARVLPVLAEAGELAEPAGWLNPTVDPAIRAGMLTTVDDPDLLIRLATGDREPAVRTAATERLLLMDPPVDKKRLWPLLENPDPVVAGLVATSLAEEPDGPLVEVLQRQLIERIDYDALLAFLEALGMAWEADDGALAPSTANKPPSDSLQHQVSIRVAELRSHPDLAMRSAAGRVAEHLGLPSSGPAPFPKLPDDETLADLLGVRVITSRGELVISFETQDAPFTVTRWVDLAESGAFDGRSFHRIVPDFVVQGGCPRGDGYGGPGFALPDELSPLPYGTGAVGMATGGPDTAGSQWFVTLSPQPHLDRDYTLFGQLVQGQETLRRLRQGDLIEAVIIERRGPSSHP